MIGVLAQEGEERVVEEFFQLFKTQWEFWEPDKKYDSVLVTGERMPDNLGSCPALIFQSQPLSFDAENGIIAGTRKNAAELAWQDARFPVYGDVLTLQTSGEPLICAQGSNNPVACLVSGTKGPAVRVGFDLFREVAFLLTHGQPEEHAHVATLDIHISFLRSILRRLRVPFVEVLPAPHGYDFAACLTHDVDFVGVRDHKFDHTMWGFLYRSTIGSLRHAIAGRIPWSRCLKNWAAALSLPLVHLGLREDFWLEFDRYTEIEKHRGSTFFFLPFKDAPGLRGSAPAPKRRAAKYELSAVTTDIEKLRANECEVGLHGIDAWRNAESAQTERSRIEKVTGPSEMGTRMHWLYWDQSSPKALEQAGFVYDSTFGYNNAIGFRAGTAQPFCPLNASGLIELPLVIQDSAMFYSGRMMLSEPEALAKCRSLLHTVTNSGGALTINWHTRSLSPERFWDKFYQELLKEIQKYRVWFGTGMQVVRWFKERRALQFRSVQFEEDGVRFALSGLDRASGSRFTVRVFDPRVDEEKSLLLDAASASQAGVWKGEQIQEFAS